MNFPNLQQTSLGSALSPLGKKIFLPNGIFYWSGRAKAEAEIDATIGTAQDDDGTVSHLKIAEKLAGEEMMNRLPKAKVFGYAPIPGVDSLRKKWLARILVQHKSLTCHATMPVITNGITHSIALASHLLLNKGQTLLTADNSWENYEQIFTAVQGVNVEKFLMFDARGKFNIPAMIKACASIAAKQKKVVLLLNFPHNKTGFMPSKTECDKIGIAIKNFCRTHPRTAFVLLLDDAYEGYVYDKDGQKFSFISQAFTALPNFSICKMDGISKVMLAYGYRIGFMTFFVNSLNGEKMNDEFLRGVSAEVGNKISAFIRGEISQVNHHGQALADALMDNQSAMEIERGFVIEMLASRWRVMMDEFKKCYAKYGKKKLWADPCNGGFFCYVNLAKNLDPVKIGERLLAEKKIGVVPAGQGMRIAFAGVPKSKISKMVRAIFGVVYG